MAWYRFSHLLNTTSVEGPLPTDVLPGHQLVRATEAAARRLRLHIAGVQEWFRREHDESALLGSPNQLAVFPYEVPAGGGDMPQPNQWRYYGILTAVGDGDDAATSALRQLHDIERAGLFLPDASLEVGCDVSWEHGKTEVTGAGGVPRQWTQRHATCTITAATVGILQGVLAKLPTHDHEKIDLRIAMSEMRDLRQLDPHSRFRFLGHCAVMESLLTHKQHKDYDSLTHQLTTKMVLIGNRWGLGEAYQRHFPNAAAQGGAPKIWHALYEYRSAIAHGNSARKLPPLLGDFDTAARFLTEAAACAMRAALDEPDLLRDLKKC